MRNRDVVGKRVKRVKQTRCTTNYGEPVYDVEWIEFEDGSRLVFSVCELEDGYAVEGSVYK